MTTTREPRNRRRTATSVLLAAGLGLAAAACGSADADGPNGPNGPTATVATTAAPAASDAPSTTATAGQQVVTVVLQDYGFAGLPASVPAGTRLTVENRAAAELHELVAIRLPDSEQRSAHELLALPPEQLEPLMSAAPPAAVLLAVPGGDAIPAVGDGTLTEPGRYLILCSIPTGVDPQVYLDAAAASNGAPPQVDGGPPHFVHGMFAELVVD